MTKQFLNTSTHLRALCLLMALLMLGTGIARAAEGSEGVGVRVVIDEESTYYQTTEKTVGEFLKSQDIEVGESDIINFDMDDEIKNAMRIVIAKSFEVEILVDGEDSKKIVTNVETIGKVIAGLREDTGLDYVLQDGLASSTKLQKGDVIGVKSVKEETRVETEDIPFETNVVDCDDLFVGETKVIQKGANGKLEKTIKDVFTSGEMTDSYVAEQNVIVTPITEVIEKGTKVKSVEKAVPVAAVNKSVAPNGASAKKVVSMNISAYCPCSRCCGSGATGRTANGTKAGYGVVAVDTRVIPLGTKLYVDGYGYAVAADTGGAIKGNKIDVCFSSHSAALKFGRKTAKVYILS